MKLLVTRPEYDARRTAAELRRLGHEPVLAPLLRIEPKSADFGPETFAGIIFTSINAARAVADHPRLNEIQHLPVFAVGVRTAEAAREAGFNSVYSADGDAGDLVALIAARCPSNSTLLYLAGEDRAADLGAALSPYGITVRVVEIYRAAAQLVLPSPVLDVVKTGTLDGALHYSRRSAETFVKAMEAAHILAPAVSLVHYCLSAEVALPLVTAGARSVKIAERPEENALLGLLSLD